MKVFIRFVALGFVLLLDASFLIVTPNEDLSLASKDFVSFGETDCKSTWNGDVQTKNLTDGGRSIGYSIWISRQSKRAKAKYFAHKQYGEVVNDRYNSWRQDKEVILMSSGAYATGWDGEDVPAGITVDNGQIVNRNYKHTMDGLVIIYATGGVVVSNIEDGDLEVGSLNRTLDITNPLERNIFLKWAEKENATVFQTHLLAYKNSLKFTRRKNESAKRKFLILAKDAYGELFHIIFYMKNRSYSLYDGANGALSYLNGQRMNVIAMVNLDTGAYDVLHTGGEVRDCNGKYITGSKHDRANMTNLLSYEYD